MKSITSTLSGLTSSLLLSAGLTEAAQKFDPVSAQPCGTTLDARGPAMSNPCYFTPKRQKS